MLGTAKDQVTSKTSPVLSWKNDVKRRPCGNTIRPERHTRYDPVLSWKNDVKRRP